MSVTTCVRYPWDNPRVFRAAAEGCEVPGWLDMDMGRHCSRRNISSNWTGCSSNHSRNSFVKQTAWKSFCSQPGSLILSGVAGAQAFSGNHGGLALPARRPVPALVPLAVAAGAGGRAAASPRALPGWGHGPRPCAAAAGWQKRRVPARRRRSEAVPCTSPQHHDSSGTQFCIWGDRGDERDALSLCVMPWWRLWCFFRVKIFTAESRLPCSKGNLPEPLEVK